MNEVERELSTAACASCGRSMIKIPKVFSKELFGKMFFCDNEACSRFEQKIHINMAEDDIDWGVD